MCRSWHEGKTKKITKFKQTGKNKQKNADDFQDWTLQIKYVQMRDAGLYECQVTKYPPTSIFVTLNVVGKLSS